MKMPFINNQPQTEMSEQEQFQYRDMQYRGNIVSGKKISMVMIALSTLLLISNYIINNRSNFVLYSEYNIIYLVFIIISLSGLIAFSVMLKRPISFFGVFIENSFPFLLMMCIVGLTILDTRTAGQITPYLIGILVIAVLFRTHIRYFIVFVSIILIAVCIGILNYEHNINTTSHYLVNLTAVSIIALIVFTITEKNRMRSFKQQKLIEKQRDVLQQLSITDPLTGLNNRRYLFDKLPAECERAIRYKRSLSVMVIDIDHFKKVNDTLGHQAGDDVLKNTALAIQGAIRLSDYVCRYGGEEFVVVLIESDWAIAEQCAERIRERCQSIKHDSVPWDVTVSIGLYQYSGGTSDDLLAQADANLYSAKNSGRNRVNSERKTAAGL
jgi:diguanylate cyclase (GGDEF)-like protein